MLHSCCILVGDLSFLPSLSLGLSPAVCRVFSETRVPNTTTTTMTSIFSEEGLEAAGLRLWVLKRLSSLHPTVGVR